MTTEENIEKQVKAALEYVRAQPVVAKPLGVKSMTSIDDPNVISVGTRYEFYLAYVIAVQLFTGKDVLSKAAHEWINKEVSHECAHFDAAFDIGVKNLRFCLLLENGGPSLYFSPTINLQHLPGEFSDLEFAAIAGAPVDPSEDDLAQLKAYGFSSTEELVTKILEHNGIEGAKQLPIPQAFRDTQALRAIGF